MLRAEERILCVNSNASSNLAARRSITAAIEVTRDLQFDLHPVNHKLVGLEIDRCNRPRKVARTTSILFYQLFPILTNPYKQFIAAYTTV